MKPDQQAEHSVRMRRISDKCEQLTGNRPNTLAADPKTAVALEALLDTLLATAAQEVASDEH